MASHPDQVVYVMLQQINVLKINLENEKTIILYLEKLNLLLESHLDKKDASDAVELEIESVVNFLVGLSYSRLSTLYGPI